MENEGIKEVLHHKKQELCKTRPAYRQGRKLTAVKVYTINNESQHLFIYGVPTINLRAELKNLCTRYGQVLSIHVVEGYKNEIFTECYHVQFDRIQAARIAKRVIDNRSFYGGILHVCYAPEYETVQETKAKLFQRNKDVLNRLPGIANESLQNTSGFKRKFSNGTTNRKEKLRKYDEPYLEDPILNVSKTKDNVNNVCSDKSERQVNLVEIGPVNVSKEVNIPTFIPRQIKKYSEKKIVFRKK